MTSPPPNILLYCTDQQRFDTIAALGNPHIRTPRLDRLLGDGVAFTHAYCQSPICTPSRSSFMTGLYPSRLHSTRNGNETFPASAPPLISKLLAEAGYDCGNVGKFHLTSAGRRTEPRLDDGYSYWQFSHAPRDDWEENHHYADWVREKGGDLDALRASPGRVPTELHQTTWASEKAADFIALPRDRPWFLSVNPYDPHPPFIPPQSYADRYDPARMPGPHYEPGDLKTQRRLAAADFQGEARPPEEHDAWAAQASYYAMIEQIDDRFADLLDALEASGQHEDTLVIFTSDHGETLGDHGLMEKGCRFYEGLVRVPLILHWPGKISSGLRCDGLAELLDLSATVLDAAGLEIPGHHQGFSLLPWARGEADPARIRDSVRCEYFDALDSHFTGGSGAYATLHRRGPWKLSLYHSIGTGELYNLDDDPWEHRDLWDSPAHQNIKHRLVHESFDRHVLLTTDVGSRRIAPM